MEKEEKEEKEKKYSSAGDISPLQRRPPDVVNIFWTFQETTWWAFTWLRREWPSESPEACGYLRLLRGKVMMHSERAGHQVIFEIESFDLWRFRWHLRILDFDDKKKKIGYHFILHFFFNQNILPLIFVILWSRAHKFELTKRQWTMQWNTLITESKNSVIWRRPLLVKQAVKSVNGFWSFFWSSSVSTKTKNERNRVISASGYRKYISPYHPRFGNEIS